LADVLPDTSVKDRQTKKIGAVAGDCKMKKYNMVCPITGGKCIKCSLYRGRHYKLCLWEPTQSPEERNGTDKNLQRRDQAKEVYHRIPINQAPYPQ
jgi:hypothetical protein